jgi:hypothetical protein
MLRFRYFKVRDAIIRKAPQSFGGGSFSGECRGDIRRPFGAQIVQAPMGLHQVIMRNGDVQATGYLVQDGADLLS